MSDKEFLGLTLLGLREIQAALDDGSMPMVQTLLAVVGTALLHHPGVIEAAKVHQDAMVAFAESKREGETTH